MTFTYFDRCYPLGVACGSWPPPAPAAPGNPPVAGTALDLPVDLICTGVCTSASQVSPSFFARYRLGGVSTFAGAVSVDTWQLNTEWVSSDIQMGYKLWVRTIQRTTPINTGTVQTSVQPVLPYIYFDATPGSNLANRVDAYPAGGVPYMRFFRIGYVINEFGGRTDITYGVPHGCNLGVLSGNYFFDYVNNGHDCYQQWYTPTGAAYGVGAFYKYLVTDTYDADPIASNPTIHTNYLYSGPAWKRNDQNVISTDVNTPYNIFRGSDTVTTTVGDGATKTRSTTWFYTGMNGDECPSFATTSFCSGGIRTVSWGGAFGFANLPTDVDHDWLAGKVRATARVDTDGTHLFRTYNHHIKQDVVINGFQDSRRVLSDYSYSWANEWGSWSGTRTDTTFNSLGAPVMTVEHGF